jgi:YegS/Rv2252/BmrU family lipid kinase
MTRKIRLIFNAHADRGRAWDEASAMQEIIQRHGGAEWSATEYPGHAAELAEQASRDGYDIVAALGGDGTVHEVVNGIMRAPGTRKPQLGAVPIGSGNDFCANNGIATDLEQAMTRVFLGTPKPVDLGRVTDGSGRTEYLDNTLSIGFGAAVTIHSYKITRLQGFSMYLWAVILTILRNYDAAHLKIKTDETSIEQDALMLGVCNGPREGGGFYTAPDARTDDGVLNYTLVDRVSRPMMFRLLPEFMRGTHGGFRQVHMGRCKWLELTSDRPVPIHIDGEVFAGFTSDVRKLRIEVLPGALQVIV